MSDFVEYLVDQLAAGWGPAEAHRMFGAHGLFRDGLMFAIVEDDVLYLKADDRTRDDFVSRELRPFTYMKQGKEARLGFYEAPAEVLEDPRELATWAEAAYQVAVRAKQPGLRSRPRH